MDAKSRQNWVATELKGVEAGSRAEFLLVLIASTENPETAATLMGFYLLLRELMAINAQLGRTAKRF